MKAYFMLMVLVFTCACATTAPQTKSNPYPNLNDTLFPGYQHFAPETPEVIFELSDEAKVFVDKAIRPYEGDMRRMKELVNSIFDHSEMGLQYSGSANATATETFEAQVANCLSLSIMTYAMADYAGYQAQFYDVDIPEYWTRRDGYSLLNGHINLKVSQAHQPNIFLATEASVDVDFDPQQVREYFQRKAISKNRVLAMYYNNKGADALLANSYTRAYSYFRAGAMADPAFSEVWVNLGVLYRINGANRHAERAYRRALKANPGNRTAWENLAVLYRIEGDEGAASQIMARLERERDANPFYHYILGEQSLEEGDVEQALIHYKRALQRDRSRHEVMFGLGKAFYQLGDISRAKHYMELAEKRASAEQDKHKYRGKLSLLQTVVNHSK